MHGGKRGRQVQRLRLPLEAKPLEVPGKPLRDLHALHNDGQELPLPGDQRGLTRDVTHRRAAATFAVPAVRGRRIARRAPRQADLLVEDGSRLGLSRHRVRLAGARLLTTGADAQAAAPISRSSFWRTRSGSTTGLAR